MFLVRPAEEKDLKGLVQLSAYLDSMNLPHNKKLLRTLIHVSQDSFSNRVGGKQRGKYLFVAQEFPSKKIVGCSAIFSQHGTQIHPHLYFQVRNETKKSHYLGKTFNRKYLTLEKMKQGPTEMCALVVLPRYRHRSEHIGLQLAFARYLYIWKHPEKFKRRFLSELNGVHRKNDGGNALWDALGGKLTGLDYHTADRLSAVSKEFILSSYPKTRFYVDLLPKKAQQVLEKTDPNSQGALHLLEKIGYRYLKQCCPFDGGPHYGARWEEIRLFQKIKVAQVTPSKETSLKQALIIWLRHATA